MNHEEFTKLLIDECKLLPGFYENNSHIRVRCPNCETHRTDDKEGHFYINKQKEGNPSSCRKCDLALMTITPELLLKLNIENSEILEYVKKNYKEIHTHIVNLDERNKKLDYRIHTDIKNHEINKLRYLNDRLGHDFTKPEELEKFRIVSSFKKFLKLNKIDIETLEEVDRRKIDMIESYYVGFLSYFGNIINFRRIFDYEDGTDQKLKRYETVVINRSIKRSFLYIPSTSIDPLTMDPKINVSEGPIDIISIYLNNSQFDNNNAIYVASNSIGAFRRSIMNALSISGFFGASINLYLDNDDGVKKIGEYDFSKITHAMMGFGRSFKVTAFVNLASKDFGDVSEPIVIGKMNLTNSL